MFEVSVTTPDVGQVFPSKSAKTNLLKEVNWVNAVGRYVDSFPVNPSARLAAFVQPPPATLDCHW